MGLANVSDVLWQERRLLELLVFKLEEEKLILATGDYRWLPHASKEVSAVLEEIRQLEIRRASTIDEVAGDLGLSDSPRLADLAEVPDAAWAQIFAEHQKALVALKGEIEAIARAGRDHIRNNSGVKNVHRRMAAFVRRDIT